MCAAPIVYGAGVTVRLSTSLGTAGTQTMDIQLSALSPMEPPLTTCVHHAASKTFDRRPSSSGLPTATLMALSTTANAATVRLPTTTATTFLIAASKERHALPVATPSSGGWRMAETGIGTTSESGRARRRSLKSARRTSPRSAHTPSPSLRLPRMNSSTTPSTREPRVQRTTGTRFSAAIRIRVQATTWSPRVAGAGSPANP